MLNQETIKAELSKIKAPYLDKDLITAGLLSQLEVTDNTVIIKLTFGYPATTQFPKLIADIKSALKLIGVDDVDVNIETKIKAHYAHNGDKPLPEVKNVIAVSSCKGGVGKSTTAVNLALALALDGARVGILDADIYGPSQPQMLGVNVSPEASDKQKFKPIIRHELQSMSIGYLVDVNAPMIWRGPMVSGALQQLLYDTEWQGLDYLIIDLPPGTGDIQLTLAQKLPLSGSVLVTTPQEIALRDAIKGLAMFQKVNIPVLGVIENMSLYVCPKCQHEAAIFGSGGGETMAREHNIELLGHLPLSADIRAQADSGTPTVAAEPESANSYRYRHIAGKIAAQLAEQAPSFAHKFPKIVVESN